MFIFFSASSSFAQNPNAPPPLSTLLVPEPPNLSDFVKDKATAIKLGKALFWEMQAGSDGIQACASCHFHAGADSRIKNNLSPGLLGGNSLFDPTSSGASGGANYAMTTADFPFHKRDDPERFDSNVIFDTDDVTSSQGVHNTLFVDVAPGVDVDVLTPVADAIFNVGGINVRKVESRNTPSVINAIFYVDNFWDGRAKFCFNGENPFGELDLGARILEKQVDGSVIPVKVRIKRASLASQAVGPPLSDFEMGSAGRTFPKLGKKLLSLAPLAKQLVDPADSELGALSNYPVPGISGAYKDMIEAAFVEKFWDSDHKFLIDKTDLGSGLPANTNEFTLIWGLAIQLYEATLVSDDSKFDQFQQGLVTLTKEEEKGLDIFLNQGQCINCHSGPEFTNATIDQLIDNPVEDDDDGDFFPLSYSRFAKRFDQTAIECIDVSAVIPPVGPNERDAVDGATPSKCPPSVTWS